MCDTPVYMFPLRLFDQQLHACWIAASGLKRIFSKADKLAACYCAAVGFLLAHKVVGNAT